MKLARFRLKAVLLSLLCVNVHTAQAQPVDGRLDQVEACDDFFLVAPSLLGGLITFDFPDPAWVRVAKRATYTPPAFVQNRRFVSATGVVAGRPAIGDYPHNPLGDEAVVNFKDFPDVHDSHDMNFYIALDPTPQNIAILSTFGLDSHGREPGDPGYSPDTLEVEWETGILTSQLTGDGRFFPKSMWPVPGDRVWANGYWIFDCGHTVKNEATGEEGLRSEIHPPRAIATMRSQVAIPQGAIAPIPVTAVDLYIHGRAGIVVDLLECGGDVILGNRTCPTRTGETPPGSDSDDGDPSHDIALDHVGVPIAEDFEFTVCTPPQPPAVSPDAEPIFWPKPPEGPSLEPQLIAEPATDGCTAPGYGPKQVKVRVPLAGSGLTPDDVYARQLYVGWAAPPTPMRRFKVTLNTMRLGDDQDHDSTPAPPGDPDSIDDCECSWFWMHIDRSLDEWRRLSDHADDPDDPDQADGDEHLNNFREATTRTFTNATWEFLVPDGEPFTMRAFGYDGGVFEDSEAFDQDCLDDHFAHHDLPAHVNIAPPFEFPDACYLGVKLFGQGNGNDDPFDIVQHRVTSADITAFFGAWPGIGSTSINVVSSPLHCKISRLGIDVRVVCQSAAQVCEDLGDLCQQVEIEEYHEVGLGVTIESLPADSDGDGLNDSDEVSTHHTDPLDADTDGDSLTDGAEVNTHHTDPFDPDTDDDQLPDGIEVSVGTDPLDNDSDNDGIPDGRDPQFVSNAVSALPGSAFRAEGNKTAIIDILAAVDARIAKGAIDQAIRELEIFRAFIDGCGTVADTTDWIVDCVAQVRVRDYVDLLLTNLGA
jgi:Bacterial TSP3 repeat